MYLIIAIVNAISTYLVVPHWGAIGAAFCSGVSYIVGQGVIMNVYYHKVTGIDIPLFWKNIFSMSKVPAGMMALGLLLERRLALNAWLPFLFAVAVFTGCYAFLMYRFGMNDYERGLFREPAGKILRFVRGKQP